MKTEIKSPSLWLEWPGFTFLPLSFVKMSQTEITLRCNRVNMVGNEKDIDNKKSLCYVLLAYSPPSLELIGR